MVLLDANVLIYAFCSGLPQYPAAKAWLAELLDSERRVGVSWLGIVAFVRIATNVRLAAAPLSMEAAMRYVGTLLAEPNVEVVEPGPNHFRYFEEACRSARATSNLVTDAHYAALAMEYDCELASTDTDFARFPGLRWVNPLAPAA